MIRAADLPVRDVVEPATVRLVTADYTEKPAMALLADDPSELAFLEEIEGLTSALTPSSSAIPAGIQPGELLTEADGYGWRYVNAAFCHMRPTGNRFNGPERGAWYASYGNKATDTAKAEVAWHLTRELRATGIYENITTYRELLAGFMSRFHDLGERTDDVSTAETLRWPIPPDRRWRGTSWQAAETGCFTRPLATKVGGVWWRYGLISCRTSARGRLGCSDGRGRRRWRY